VERFSRIGAGYIVSCIIGGIGVTAAGVLVPDSYGPLRLVLVLAGGIAIGIGMLGIVIDVRELGRDQSRTAREQAFRLDLAQLLTEGNQLVSAVPRDEDAVAMDAAYSAAQVWGSAVTDRLDAEHPGWSAVFLDDTFGTQLFAGNAPRQSILQSWYQRRLTRLRELWARVP